MHSSVHRTIGVLLTTAAFYSCWSCSSDTTPPGLPSFSGAGAAGTAGAAGANVAGSPSGGCAGETGDSGASNSGGNSGQSSGGSSTAGTGGTPGAGAHDGQGHVLYMTPDYRIHLIEATNGAVAQDLTDRLDQLSEGDDKGASLSPDGRWLSLVTTRFGCDWECLVLVDVEVTQSEVVLVGGNEIHPENQSAVLSGGNAIVYVGKGGPHEEDLYFVKKNGQKWAEPVLLTGSSAYAYNRQPAVAADGSRVVFDCGDAPYGGDGTNICETSLDGSPSVKTIVRASFHGSGGRLHSPSYTPDGNVVMEGEWSRELVARWQRGTKQLQTFEAYTNDNTPCVLPDGRVASLWLGREGGSGEHELKIMSADASSYFMLIENEDLLDTQISCGK